MSVGSYYKPELSQKRKSVLVLDGYVMAINKNINNKFYWHCSYKYKYHCNSTATTKLHGSEEHLLESYTTQHNHAPDPGKVDELRFRNSLKSDATSSLDRPSQIIQRNEANISKSSSCALPNKKAASQIIRRARRKEMPKEPITLDDINIPDRLQKVDGERFLGRQVKFEENCVMLFATKSNLILLNKSQLWVMDGTFATCPILFKQIYSIHGLVDTGTDRYYVPLVYAFLTNKTLNCYLYFFQALKAYALEYDIPLNPRVIMTDFEMAVINSVKEEFPDAQHKCCLFHLGQNVWRQIQQNGLQSKYGQDAEFAVKLRHIIALAYLHQDEIPDAFDKLREEVLPDEASDITNWFGKYYVWGNINSRETGNNKLLIARSAPMFPPSLWSVFQNNTLGLPRTQNNIEGWHRRWNTLLDKHKRGLYATIEFLVKEQAITNRTIEKANAGLERPTPQKRGKRDDNAIEKILNSKNNMDLLEFLRAIAIHTKY